MIAYLVLRSGKPHQEIYIAGILAYTLVEMRDRILISIITQGFHTQIILMRNGLSMQMYGAENQAANSGYPFHITKV